MFGLPDEKRAVNLWINGNDDAPNEGGDDDEQ